MGKLSFARNKHGGRKRGRARPALSAVMAAALVVGLLPVTTLSASAAPAYADEGDGLRYAPIAQIVEEGLDRSLVPEEEPPAGPLSLFRAAPDAGLEQTGRTLVVKQTMLLADKVREGEGFDELWADQDRLADAWLAQFQETATVYDPGESSEYYVAYVGGVEMTSPARVIDWQAAYYDTQATMAEGASYDAETGIAYLPKALWAAADAGGEQEAVQIQLLVAYDVTAERPRIDVEIENASGEVTAVSRARSIEADPFDLSVDIPVATPETAGGIGLADLRVYLNGSERPVELVEGETAVWHADTGVLTLAATGTQVVSVRVEIGGRAWWEPEAAYAVSADKMSCLHDLDGNEAVLAKFDPDKAVEWTQAYKYRSAGYYSTDTKVPWKLQVADTLWDCLYVGSIHSAVHSGSGTAKDVLDAIRKPTGSSGMGDANDLVNCTFDWPDRNRKGGSPDGSDELPPHSGDPVVGGIDWTGFPATAKLDNGDKLYRGAAQCSHIGTVDGNSFQGSAEGGYWWFTTTMRILKVADDYVVLSFFIPTFSDSVAHTGQSGAAVYKIKYEAKGAAQVRKVSAEPDATEGNAAYSLKNAVFAIFKDTSAADAALAKAKAGEWATWREARDWAKANSPAVFVTDAEGNSKVVEGIDAGTYRLVELFAPKGHKLLTKHKKFAIASGSDNVSTIEVSDPVVKGRAQVLKVSAEPEVTDGNGCYSYKNAVFAAVADAAYADTLLADAARGRWGSWSAARDWALGQTGSGKVAAVFVTDADGRSPVTELYGGSYRLVELFAPEGYKLPREHMPLKVEASQDATALASVTVADPPHKGSIDVKKSPSKPGLSNGNACYDIGGAVYTVYKSQNCDPASRYADIAVSKRADGTAYGKLDNVPLGSYWVRETKRAASGFGLDQAVYPVTVKADETAHVGGNAGVKEDEKLDPAEIFLMKKDAATGEGAAQGGSSLGDAHYRIDYYDVPDAKLTDLEGKNPKASWVVRTDDDGYFQLRYADRAFIHAKEDGSSIELPYKVSGPDFYRLSTGKIGMPLGTYTVTEVKAPAGYLLDATVHVRHINEDGTDNEAVHSYNAEEGNDPITDEVARGDLTFVKTAQGEARMPNVPFKVTSKATGEWHVVVSDRHGRVSTASTLTKPHSMSTNANDAQFRAEDGSFRMPMAVDTAALSSASGVWFSGAAPGSAGAPVDDGEGALPYDTYLIEEIRCPANEMFNMYTDEIPVTEEDHKALIDLGTVDNNGDTIPPVPSIGTAARDAADGDRLVAAGPDAAVIDRVEYVNLKAGAAYRLVAALMDRETGLAVTDADGAPVTAEREFSVPGTDGYTAGYVEVAIPVDATALAGKSLVVFEQLIDADGERVAAHEDIDDWYQTVEVSVPKIGTTLADAADGDQAIVSEPVVHLTDTVAYENMPTGRELTVIGTLMAKTEEGIAPLLDAEGNPVTAETAFTPEEGSGTVEVTFTFDGALLGGIDALVAYERVLLADAVVASHEDPDDPGQTVVPVQPSIGTTLTDADGDKTVVPAGEVRLTDTVAYENAPVGRELTVTGTLMAKTDEGAAPLLDAEGNPVTAEAAFVPETASGTIEVTFAFDGTLLAGGDVLVAYERLLCAGSVLAVHEDPDDPGQTVEVAEPSIGTTATDASDGDKELEASDGAVVRDEVAYENLIPGAEYALEATLMARAADGTVAPLARADGAPVTGSATFVPEKPSGTEIVSFAFDATGLEGATLVAYERLLCEGRVVAAHEDPDDEGQTVTVTAPEIGTELTDATDGDHVLLPSRRAVVVDTVAYKGLVPGREYTLSGVLMDKETGKPLVAGDSEVRSEKRFTPNKPDGEIEMEFSFDASALAGREIVAFEELTKDGREVAVHADIEDESQTVSVETPLPGTGGETPGGFFGKTGADAAVAVAVALAAVAAGAAALVLTRRRKDGEDPQSRVGE